LLSLKQASASVDICATVLHGSSQVWQGAVHLLPLRGALPNRTSGCSGARIPPERCTAGPHQALRCLHHVLRGQCGAHLHIADTEVTRAPEGAGQGLVITVYGGMLGLLVFANVMAACRLVSGLGWARHLHQHNCETQHGLGQATSATLPWPLAKEIGCKAAICMISYAFLDVHQEVIREDGFCQASWDGFRHV